MVKVGETVQRAYEIGLAVPAFNVPYLPMVEPLVQAVVDADAFALIETARLEWIKFEGQGPAAVLEEFKRWERPEYVRLHLDHVPVLDEDGQWVDYMGIIREALALGYESVMVDGSRVSLGENIAATRAVAELAHTVGASCEGELGAVFGHEAGPPLPYDELFASGRGFTDPDEAARFVRESGCDWLSVAIGNVHGAISGALKDQKKVEARLNIEHLDRLRQATGIPLVLHGGSGVAQEDIRAAMHHGIAKINVATEVRQAYEAALRTTGRVVAAQQAVYARARWLLCEYLGLAGTRRMVTG